MNVTLPTVKFEKGLSTSIGWRGEVLGLHLAPRAFLPQESRRSLNLIADVGVEGDRYAKNIGFLSKKLHEVSMAEERNLSLFEQETVDWLANRHNIVLGPGDHRRNVTTRGVPLTHLYGKKFRIGQTLMLGFEPAPACKHLDEVAGKEMVFQLINRAGLFARVLTGGPISVGDIIEPVED